MRRLLTILAILILPLSGYADDGWGDTMLVDMGHPRMLHLRSNLLYDAVVVPNLGVEFSTGSNWSFVIDGSCMWIANEPRHRYWRVATAGMELRYWPGASARAFLRKGHHIGLFGSLFRYDIEFGKTGYMADLNYGGGISWGYAAPLGSHFSLDFTLGVGYLGGKWKEYQPSGDAYNHYVWQRDRRFNWFGPAKAEITLVWHIELTKPRVWKGGGVW
jgi:hypothetical protein